MNKQRRAKISNVIIKLSAIAEELEAVYEEEESVYDNMPENLQGSQRYTDMETALEYMDDARDDLASAIENLMSVE